MANHNAPTTDGKFVSFEAYVDAVSNYRKLLNPERYKSNTPYSPYSMTFANATEGMDSEDALNEDGNGIPTNIKPNPVDAAAIAKAKEAMDLAEVSFVNTNGVITNLYICNGSKTATLTCEKPAQGIFSRKKTRFYTQYDLGKQPEMERLLVEIDYLAAESSRLLRGDNLNRCLKLIYKTAKNTMVLLDGYYHGNGEEPMPETIEKTIKVIEHNLAQAKAFHKRVAKFTAQTDYLVGNLIGFTILCWILFIIVYLNGLDFKSLFNAFGEDNGLKLSSLLFYGATAGSIGAIISVMNRVSSGNFSLNYDPDSRTIRVIGMFRPVIGAVFGAVILILFNSGLSIFSLTEAGPSKVASNLILLGFIAGFFERMVPDILDQTKDKLTSGENSTEAVDATAVEE